MTKCYKVVRVCKGQLMSAILSQWVTDGVADEEYKDAILTYEAGKTTTANFGGILTFHTLAAARKFRKGESSRVLQIWRAIGHDPVEIKDWNLASIEAMREAWDAPFCVSDWWPTGTLAFKSIQLVSKVR